eukprot:5261501-Prymnesium_polylepis.1
MLDVWKPVPASSSVQSRAQSTHAVIVTHILHLQPPASSFLNPSLFLLTFLDSRSQSLRLDCKRILYKRMPHMHDPAHGETPPSTGPHGEPPPYPRG